MSILRASPHRPDALAKLVTQFPFYPWWKNGILGLTMMFYFQSNVWLFVVNAMMKSKQFVFSISTPRRSLWGF